LKKSILALSALLVAALLAHDVSAEVIVTRGRFNSVQVNLDAGGLNIVGDAANEPSIAVDPTDRSKMAVGWRQFDTIASNFRQAGNAFSTNGGASWTNNGVLDPGQFRSDPVLDFDADGNFYYSSLSALDSIEMFKSSDGGQTWGTPVSAFGGDKQWIAVDRTSGIGRGNVYQIWNRQFTCCGVSDFTRSVDGAATFQPPVAVTQPSMKWGTMSVGPDGTLYLAGNQLNSNSGQLFTKSTNAQDPAQTPTFDAPRSINLGGVATFRVSGSPNPGGLLGQTWIATDHSDGPTRGNVYVMGSVDPPGGDQVDVMFIRSTDGGATWSDPLRVNDDPQGNGAHQWFGTMSVAPNGRIDAIWNDTRNDPGGVMSEVFYASSSDGGLTFSAGEPVTPAFNPLIGWPQQNKIGDYYDMVSDNGGANLAYSATFNGEQDLYFLRIDLPGPISDLTDNGFVDFQDLTILLANWNKQVSADQGNVISPGDTPVNFADLTFLLAEWTGPAPGGSPHAALSAPAVPEPSTFVLAAVAMLGVSLRAARFRRMRA
jgi:hypothetical protein